jgi:transcriptional regulator
MYTPSAFREDRLDVLREAIARYPLATLISTAGKDIQTSHVPLVYVQTGGTAVLRGHVARANPHCVQTEANGEGLAVFTGPQHYISPKWYPSKRDHGKVVPTWNYIAVHVRGRLTFRTDAEWLWQMLEVLTNEQEGKLGTGWQITDAPRDFIDEQLAAIVGVELAVETIEGKWKLSQNRTAIDREGVIAGLESVGSELAREMAWVMRGEQTS